MHPKIDGITVCCIGFLVEFDCHIQIKTPAKSCSGFTSDAELGTFGVKLTNGTALNRRTDLTASLPYCGYLSASQAGHGIS